MSPETPGRLEIGATLRDARRRYGMDVREVETRTKIRARYIRALENEDWEALPAPAYVRGFLRTYGQMLGLDGEMLADQFRRQYGEGTAPGGPTPSEPLLSGSGRQPERPPSRAPLVIGIIGGIIVLLLLLSLIGGDDPGQQTTTGQGGQAKQAQKQARRQQKRREARRKAQEKEANKLQQEDAVLTAITGVQVCLLAGGDQALIDNQVLAAGIKEKYSGSKRYQLTIGPGSVKFVVGDEKRTLEVSEPASFDADSKGIRDVAYRGPECP